MTVNRVYMRVPTKYATTDLERVAKIAVKQAQHDAPKLTGASATRLEPVWGSGYFGIKFHDPYVWYQEQGIKPFVMKSLAGKVIPMWVDDRDGKLKRNNPKIKQRVTKDGRKQVLIFRKAARKGQRKLVTTRSHHKVWRTEEYPGAKVPRGNTRSVPRSYPGAPGRINKRTPSAPLSRSGAGRIAGGNVGVRWRHPGLAPKNFLHHAVVTAARVNGLPVTRVLSAPPGRRLARR